MRKQVFNIIEKAISELNEELDYESLKNVDENTPIFGGEEGIDSLSLVIVVTHVESEIYNQFEKSVSLTSEKAMSMQNSPYKNVGTLLDLAVEYMEED